MFFEIIIFLFFNCVNQFFFALLKIQYLRRKKSDKIIFHKFYLILTIFIYLLFFTELYLLFYIIYVNNYLLLSLLIDNSI